MPEDLAVHLRDPGRETLGREEKPPKVASGQERRVAVRCMHDARQLLTLLNIVVAPGSHEHGHIIGPCARVCFLLAEERRLSRGNSS